MQDSEEDSASRLKTLPMKRSIHLLDELHSRGPLHELPNIADDDGVTESDMLVCQNMHICVYVGEKQLIIALA